MIYRIGANCHLAGSIHILPADFDLPDIYWDVHRAAEIVYFESDLEADAAAAWVRLGKLDARSSLANLIASDLYGAVSALWKELQIGGRLAQLKPWAAAFTLQLFLAVREGLLIEHGADRQLWNATEPANRRWLETPEDALASLAAMPKAEALHMLRATAKTTDIAVDRLWEIHDAWTARSEDRFKRIYERMASELPEQVKAIGNRATLHTDIADMAAMMARADLIIGAPGTAIIADQPDVTRMDPCVIAS